MMVSKDVQCTCNVNGEDMKEKRTEKGWEAKRKYTRENFTTKGISFSKTTDADILEYLNGIDSVSSYVKELIRKDMNSKQK